MDAIKIAECVMTWFLTNYPDKEIMYFGSQNKTQILGAPYSMTKIQRKKWAEEKVREIYTLREDKSMIDLFNLKDTIFRKRLNSEEKIMEYINMYSKDNSKDVREKQKLDDIGDVCIQCQAYKFKKFVACF